MLSGLATGTPSIYDFRALTLGEVARVAPIDKLSVALVAVSAPSSSASTSHCPTGSASV